MLLARAIDIEPAFFIEICALAVGSFLGCLLSEDSGLQGFYGVYEELFSQLNQQEAEYARSSDEGLKAQNLPKFGQSCFPLTNFYKG